MTGRQNIHMVSTANCTLLWARLKADAYKDVIPLACHKQAAWTHTHTNGLYLTDVIRSTWFNYLSVDCLFHIYHAPGTSQDLSHPHQQHPTKSSSQSSCIYHHHCSTSTVSFNKIVLVPLDSAMAMLEGRGSAQSWDVSWSSGDLHRLGRQFPAEMWMPLEFHALHLVSYE